MLCTCTQSAPRVDGSIILRWDNLDHSMILWVEKIKFLFNDWLNHSALVGDWLPLNLDRFPLRRGILFVRIFECYLHPNSSNTQTIQQFKCGIENKKKTYWKSEIENTNPKRKKIKLQELKELSSTKVRKFSTQQILTKNQWPQTNKALQFS